MQGARVMSNRVLASVNITAALEEDPPSKRRPCHGSNDLDAAAHDRSRLVSHLAGLLKEPGCPSEAREAALTLIGWLARRMPGEVPHAVGAERAGHAFDKRRRG
jgi:hypothetical protein